jgi:alpha-ribazole phosphatase/probable phosphoglycerate mutase
MPVAIVYETHSWTTDNERGVATGWLPGALSDKGQELARELGGRRRDDGIDAVLVSDLARAVQTAQLALGDSGIPIHLDRRLREIDYGACNGAPVARIAAERRRRVDVPYPDGQSFRQVVEQMRDFLVELATGWAGHRVLIISHSANKWALDCLLTGASLEDLVDAPFGWREGWDYTLPDGWAG